MRALGPAGTLRPMAYVAASPEAYDGQVVGSGQCVAFVQKASGAPVTASWRQGSKVRGNAFVTRGTAIATFDTGGKYPNKPSGNHAAIYLSQDATGIWVYDQWSGQPVHKRRIRFKGGVGSPSNDADVYSVVE